MLRVVTLACIPTASEREIGAPANLRREESEEALAKRFFIKWLFSERRLPLPPELYLLSSSAYYLFSPNSRRSPSARSSLFLPNLFFLLLPPPPPLSSARRSNSQWKCHRHHRARFLPFSDDENISTKSFRRTPISARRGGTVARGKLQSSGIKGGSEARGRGRGGRPRSPSSP